MPNPLKFLVWPFVGSAEFILTINASVVDINRARRGWRRAVALVAISLGHSKHQIQGPTLQSALVILNARLQPLLARFVSTTEALIVIMPF